MSNAMSSTEEAKQRLRAEVLKAREALNPTERAAIDERIAKRLLDLPAYKQAQVVFCYISVGAEIATRALIEDMWAQGKTVCVPLCERGGIMHAHVIASFDELEEGMLGIPAPAASSKTVKPEDIDLILVPCLACNKEGYRLGYGGGYYDRYLRDASQAVKVILCREHLLLDDIPIEQHDSKADLVITEVRTYHL